MSARSGLPVESYQLLIANIATKPASLLFAGQFLRPRSPHRAAGQSYHNKPILVILPYLATLHQTVWMHIAE